MGPLLFLIFVNDLHKVTKYLDPIMFVDHRNLFYTHKNIKTVFQVVNSELQLVNEWFLESKLSLDAKKKQKQKQKNKKKQGVAISLSGNASFCSVATANHDI